MQESITNASRRESSRHERETPMSDTSNIHQLPTVKPSRQLAQTYAAIKQREYRARRKRAARKAKAAPTTTVTQPITHPVTQPVTLAPVTRRVRPSWSGIGRGLVGLAIVATGAFIAF